MIQTSPIQISDFSGGITDNFIDSAPNKFANANNFLITENKKAFTRYGVGVYAEAYAQLPMGNQRVGSVLEFDDVLLAVTGAKLYYDSGSAWEFIGNVLGDATIANYSCFTNFNKQLYSTADNFPKVSKIYVDDLGAYQYRTAGMPTLTSSPSLSGTAGGGSSYIYGFHYFYEYKVGTVTHIDAGPVKYVNILDVDAPDVNAITISNIPELLNSADTNYDVANVSVKVYRTVANEDVLYLLTTLTNGTDSYVDSTSGNSLGGQVYTTGGVLQNDPPPRCKVMHMANSMMWYGNVKVGSALLDNRVMQSVMNDPDSVPSGNFTDLDDSIVGMSSYMDRPLVFCKTSVYRLEGAFDELGFGSILQPKIADTIGCISHNSIIQTPHGVFFASTHGFAYTDGFKCFTISNDFNKTYDSLVAGIEQQKKIVGAYDKSNNRVFWTVQQSDSVFSENDKIYVCDLRWGISENMTFTTLSGNTFAPTSITFHKEQLIQADRRGYILSYREGLLSDARIDTTLPASQWGTDAIIYNLKTVALKPSGKLRSFIPRVIFSAKNTSNLSVQIISDSDVGNRTRNLKPVRWRGNFVWGDPMFTWGDPSFRWGVQGFIEQQRYFHGDDLRCTYKQVEMTNAPTLVLDSDALSTATVDTAATTITLDDVAFSWLDDMFGYSIYFEHDNYEEEYEVVSNSATTLLVTDTAGTLPNGSGVKWVVRGIPKDEILSLLDVTLLAAPLGQTQDKYTPSQDGGTP